MKKSIPLPDLQALEGIVSLLNRTAEDHPEEAAQVLAEQRMAVAVELPEGPPTITTRKTPSPAPAATPPPVIAARKLVFTGSMCVGKDHVAKAAGCTILGFADPLYELVKFFYGRCNKSEAGTRKFLQTVGQWGRGEVNEQYPLTTERAIFQDRVRVGGGAAWRGTVLATVEWAEFGRNLNLWIDSVLKRAEAVKGRVAVTNARFQNELDALKADGWQHWHVVASTTEWSKRLATQGLTLQSPALQDMSEQLAARLNATVAKLAPGPGKKLNAIWNDPSKAPPRVVAISEFLAGVVR